METRIKIYMTAGISADMDADSSFGCEIGHTLHRFLEDDWGDLCREDCLLNAAAKITGDRILGAYNTSRGRVYVINEDPTAQTQIVTVLYADEY